MAYAGKGRGQRQRSRQNRLTELAHEGVLLDWSVEIESGSPVYHLRLRTVEKHYNRWELDAFLLGTRVGRSAGEVVV